MNYRDSQSSYESACYYILTSRNSKNDKQIRLKAL